MNPDELAVRIDHTFLRPEATAKEFGDCRATHKLTPLRH